MRVIQWIVATAIQIWEYTQNLYQWKNIHHTIGEHKHYQRIEYDESTQAKLDYLTHSMPALNPQIKPFEQCQKLVDRQRAKTKTHSASMHQRLEETGLSGLIDPIWDRRCPVEEPQDYTKKKKGESSKRKEHNK